MPRYSRSSLFPDVNVWLALVVGAHIHHSTAVRWLASITGDSRIYFCRLTQISLLRLLTTEAVMGGDEVLSQLEAWRAYDQLLEDERIGYLAEPDHLETEFRSRSKQGQPAPKDWGDAYLAAFASVAELKLVTFDQAFRGRVKNLLLLSNEMVL